MCILHDKSFKDIIKIKIYNFLLRNSQILIKYKFFLLIKCSDAISQNIEECTTLKQHLWPVYHRKAGNWWKKIFQASLICQFLSRSHIWLPVIIAIKITELWRQSPCNNYHSSYTRTATINSEVNTHTHTHTCMQFV